MLNSLGKFLLICVFLECVNFVGIYKLEAKVITNKENKAVHDKYLNNEEKRFLLEIARETLESVVSYKVFPQISLKNVKNVDKFNKKRGLFVTLKINGELRGCIGNIFPNQTILESVTNNTRNSALSDRRFPPVEKHEVGQIEIEISVLSIIEEINSYHFYDIEKHGIIISKGKLSAVFLPQVAREQKWSRGETLSHLCLKAGLLQDEWKDDGMAFAVFTADVFKESDFNNLGH